MLQPQAVDEPRSGSLAEHAANKTSQFGEDGIIAAILDRIGVENAWCVEFGAWDGRRCSNTYSLITDRNFHAVLIEADRTRYSDLVSTFAGRDGVHLVNAFVGFTDADNLDTVLARTDIPRRYDVLSIDIDGNDYHAWQATSAYTPRVVVIEFNPTIPTEIEFVQKLDPVLQHGSSLRSLVALGRRKGYELAAVTHNNAIFVEAACFPRLGIEDNRPSVLRTDLSVVTHIFSGYDGTILLDKPLRLPWHQMTVPASRLQILPPWLRSYPDGWGRLRRILLRIHRWVIASRTPERTSN